MNHLAKVEEKRRLKNLYFETGRHWFGAGVYWSDRKNRFIQTWEHSSNSGSTKKELRKIANRRFRRSKTLDNEIIYNRGLYKKCFDLWWELY